MYVSQFFKILMKYTFLYTNKNYNTPLYPNQRTKIKLIIIEIQHRSSIFSN